LRDAWRKGFTGYITAAEVGGGKITAEVKRRISLVKGRKCF